MQTELYVALVVGLVLSLIYAEKVGVVPAGLVVPGYLALNLHQPMYLLALVIISLITYLFVMYVIEKVTILYGRRQFVAMLLVGLSLKLIMDYYLPITPLAVSEIAGIGVIVPGLIANTIQRQGLFHTLSSTTVLSGLTFVILSAYQMLSLT